jgi:hypothetical protein
MSRARSASSRSGSDPRKSPLRVASFPGAAGSPPLPRPALPPAAGMTGEQLLGGLFTVATIRVRDGQETLAIPAIDVPLVHAALELASAKEPRELPCWGRKLSRDRDELLQWRRRFPSAPGDGDIRGRDVGNLHELQLRPLLGACYALGYEAHGLLGAGGLKQVFEGPTAGPDPRWPVAKRGQAPERAPDGVGLADLDPRLVRDLCEADVRLAGEQMLVRKRDIARLAGDHEQFQASAAERRTHDRYVGLVGEHAPGRVAEVEVPGAERDLRMTVPECRQEHGRKRKRGGGSQAHP